MNTDIHPDPDTRPRWQPVSDFDVDDQGNGADDPPEEPPVPPIVYH